MLETMDLQYIYETLEEELFDFDYDWTDIEIGDKEYTKDEIEEAFKEYWWYYQIGYSTLDEFKWRLKRAWKSKIGIFAQRLSVYPQEISLKEKTIKKDYKNATDNKYSDTPNEPMLDVDTDGAYLTDRTHIDMDGDSTETESRNELEKYDELYGKIRDVMYDFIKSFKDLFLTDVIIYDGILKRGL